MKPNTYPKVWRSSVDSRKREPQASPDRRTFLFLKLMTEMYMIVGTLRLLRECFSCWNGNFSDCSKRLCPCFLRGLSSAEAMNRIRISITLIPSRRGNAAGEPGTNKFSHDPSRACLCVSLLVQQVQGKTRRRERDLNPRDPCRSQAIQKIFPGLRPPRLGDPGDTR